MTKRNPYVAAAMSLVIPGLGHVYAGQIQRFLVVVIAIHLAMAGLGLLGVLATFTGVWAYLLLLFAPVPFGIVDSFIAARCNETDGLSWYNRWYFYLAFIGIMIALFQGHRTVFRPLLGFDLYRVVGGDLPPTVAKFDFVVVDTKAFANQAPRQGDVVMVRRPDTNTFIGRVSRPTTPTTFSYLIGTESIEQTGVPLNTIIGKPTYVFFSRTSGNAGSRIY